MGYSFFARVVQAAGTSLGLCAAALAGRIEGAVTFPTQLVPSMTVYASDLDTSKVHSVPLARGQANFSVDVPPGRYLVFLAPNEPGAPDIYGAYTEYSLCASHDVGECQDHSLIPVTISARAPHAAVTIDDWYLTDEIAGELDRIRGLAAGGARFNSEPLSAPRFSEYPSEAFEGSVAPKIDLGDSELSEEDRAHLQKALLGGPNFAGHVTALLMRCGPACGRIVLVDWRSGQVQEPPPLAEIQGELPCRTDEAVLFRRDSRLLTLTRARDGAVITQYFVWNPKNGALSLGGEYRRTSQAFCAVAAP